MQVLNLKIVCDSISHKWRIKTVNSPNSDLVTIEPVLHIRPRPVEGGMEEFKTCVLGHALENTIATPLISTRLHPHVLTFKYQRN